MSHAPIPLELPQSLGLLLYQDLIVEHAVNRLLGDKVNDLLVNRPALDTLEKKDD